MRKFFGVLIVFTGLILLAGPGCQRQPGPSKGKEPTTAKKGGHDHDHGSGPHGGTIIEFGNWHGEFTVDHQTHEATVYILEEDAKTASPIAAKEMKLSIKSPQFQVDLQASPDKGDPAGKASRFVAKHKNFGIEQEFEGTLTGVVEGKPYAGDFKEEPHNPKFEKKK